MTYELAIHPDAEREWGRLDEAIKRRFKQKLQKERLINPRVTKDALYGVPDTYKIKITTPQFRLAYHVNDTEQCVTILAVSSRDDVYDLLRLRGGLGA
jgi:mRNA interferase RelE/StbE